MYNLRSHPPTAIWKEIVNPSGERLSCMLSSGGLNKPPFPATSARRPRVCLTLYSKLSIKKDLHSRWYLSAHKSVNKNRRYNLELDFRVSLNLYPLLAILKKKKKTAEGENGWEAPQRHSVDHDPEHLPECRTLMGVRCWGLGLGLEWQISEPSCWKYQQKHSRNFE